MSISTLYKYKSLSTTEELKHARSLICDSEIYFSSPLDFNDPFDCRPGFRIGETEEDKEKFVGELIEITPEHMAMIDKTKLETTIRNNFLKECENMGVGLCCFSEINDEILMYSHYSSSHQGFCLEFEVPNETSFFGSARKVNYSNEYPIVDPLSHSPEKDLENMFLSKSRKWEYEKERRIFAFNLASTTRKFPEELLKGIIFGCRMEEDYKILFREWEKKRSSPLQFYEARIKEKEYGLDIDPVD